MNIFFVSLGCDKNLVDSEAVSYTHLGHQAEAEWIYWRKDDENK